MLSARNLVVLFGACLLAASAFAQETPAPQSQPAPSADNTPPLTSEQRGDVYMARKMYREAIEAYEQAPQNSAVIWNKMGIAYHQMVQLDAAMRRYRRAIRLDARYPEAINNLGTVYYAEKHYGKAISCYKRAVKLEPGSAAFYINLGTAYFAEKREKDFWAAYNKALQLDPEAFEHHSSFGVALEDRSVEQHARYHYYMAKLCAKQGQNDRALQYIRKALEEGFTDRKKLMSDPEFASMRGTPEFQELLKLEPKVL